PFQRDVAAENILRSKIRRTSDQLKLLLKDLPCDSLGDCRLASARWSVKKQVAEFSGQGSVDLTVNLWINPDQFGNRSDLWNRRLAARLLRFLLVQDGSRRLFVHVYDGLSH